MKRCPVGTKAMCKCREGDHQHTEEACYEQSQSLRDPDPELGKKEVCVWDCPKTLREISPCKLSGEPGVRVILGESKMEV